MNFRSTKTAPVLIAALVLVCCEPPRIEEYAPEGRVESGRLAETEGIVLVRVDGEPITLADVERRISGLSPLAQASLDSPAARQRFLQGMILVEILAREAEADGFGADPTVDFLSNRALSDVVLERLMRENTARLEPTEETLRVFYEENGTRYQRPHEYRVLALVTATRQEADEISHEFQAQLGLGTLADRVTVFQQLREQHSIDEFTRSRSGDLGFLSRETFSAAFGEELAEQVFTNENLGALYGPVQCRQGWALLLTTREHRAIDEPFAEVEMEIREILAEDYREQTRERIMGRLRTEGEVSIGGDSRTILRNTDLPHQPARGSRLLELSDEELESLLNPHVDANELITHLAPADEGEHEGTGVGVDND